MHTPTVTEVAKVLAGGMGMPLSMPPNGVLDYVVRGYILYIGLQFDIPLTERKLANLENAIQGMSVRRGLNNLRDEIVRRNPDGIQLDLDGIKTNIEEAANGAELVKAFGNVAQWGTATRWKTFAFLHPSQVPVLDSLVVGVISGKSEPAEEDYPLAASAIMEAHKDGDWKNVCDQIHADLSVDIQNRRTTLRILDIILWTYGKTIEKSLKAVQ